MFSNSKALRQLDPGLILVLLLSLFLGIPLLSAGAQEASPWLSLGSLLMAGGGMFLFCRRRSGRLGAVLGCLLFVYSPVLTRAETPASGADSQLLALALFSLLLWRVDALRDKPTRLSYIAVFLLAVALGGLQHPLSLTLTTIAALWVACETAMQHFNREASQMRSGGGLLALLALLLGLLASASLWLPASAEVSAAVTTTKGGHFIALDALLSIPPVRDAAAITGPREPYLLGVAQWLAALLGGAAALLLYIGGFRTRHPQTFLGAGFFGLLALGLIFLVTPASRALWDSFGPLASIQSPGLLLAPAAACLAIVASMNGFWLERIEARYRLSLVALAVALPIVTALPLLYMPEGSDSRLNAPILAEAETDTAETPRRASNDAHGAEAAPSRPANALALAASAISVMGLGLVVWRLRYGDQTARPYLTAPPLARSSLYGILLGGGIALLTLAVAFREGIAWIHSPPGEALPAQFQRKISLSQGLELLGYDLSGDRLRAGEALRLTLYWRGLTEEESRVSIVASLDKDGTPVKAGDKRQPTWRALKAGLSAQGYFVDSYTLPIPSNLGAGAYDLALNAIVCQPASSQACGGASVVLTTIEVMASQ